MVETWVVNASPLIALGRIDRLHLLFDLGAEIVIPHGVVQEITRGPRAIEPSQLGPHRSVVVGALHPVVAAWDLGLGEGQVLAWAASSPGSTALLDDRAARRCAMALAIPVFGTLRLILRAKAAGLLPSAMEAVGALRESGLFLSEGLVAHVRRVAGE